jgi:hypothetical protein
MPSSHKLDSAINLFLKEIILARSGTGDFTFPTKGQIVACQNADKATPSEALESFFFLVCPESKSLLPVEISRPGNNKQKEKLVFACARLRHQAPKSRFFSFSYDVWFGLSRKKRKIMVVHSRLKLSPDTASRRKNIHLPSFYHFNRLVSVVVSVSFFLPPSLTHPLVVRSFVRLFLFFTHFFI